MKGKNDSASATLKTAAPHRQVEVSRQIIEAISDSTQSYIVLIAPNFRIIFFNKRAWYSSKHLFGKELIVGESILRYERRFDDAVFKDFYENFYKAITSGHTVSAEREMKYSSMTFWLRTEYTPVFEQEEIIGVALRVVDITERKMQEMKIKEQSERLKQIAWIQSHETRQPIATILGLINILDKSSLSEDNNMIIAMLEATVTKLDNVIRDTVVSANA